MDEAESIDLEQKEEMDLEGGTSWVSTSSTRSSTSSSPGLAGDVVEVVTSGSPVQRWVDTELLSFFHQTVMASRSVDGDGDDDDDDYESHGLSVRSQTMRRVESVVDTVRLPRDESRALRDGALRTYDLSTQNLSYKVVSMSKPILCLICRDSVLQLLSVSAHEHFPFVVQRGRVCHPGLHHDR